MIVKPCDVASRKQVQKLVTEDLYHLPPIKGVIHAAMVLDVSDTLYSRSQSSSILQDVLFEKMTYAQWTSVVSPKVSGAWNFHHALQSNAIPLDFFVLLSSAAGAVGNRGQAAYSAANCFLNAFAQFRLSQGLPASSIDLTAVSDAGYLAEGSA